MRSIFTKGIIIICLLIAGIGLKAQVVTVTNPTFTTPALAASYTSLANAITALNGITAISGAVTITLNAGNPQTAPVGGYVISFTAVTTAARTVTITGNNNTITANASLVAGSLTDAIFKVVGVDFLTIQNFTMQENAANSTTALASNNMTEWGVALLYASATNGAQNNTIQYNTISLNKTYSNTFGIYSNTRHTATTINITADVTSTAGANSNNNIYGNAISNVNMGIAFIGSGDAGFMDLGNDIGGASVATANTITNWGGLPAGSIYISNSGSCYGIFLNNQKNETASFNTITSSTVSGTSVAMRGIFKTYATVPTGTFTSSITNNVIRINHNFSSGVMNGIRSEGISTPLSTATININNNRFQTMSVLAATSSTDIVGITNTSQCGVLNLNNNIFRGANSTATSGGFTAISNTGAVQTAVNINGNQIGDAAGNAITFSAATSAALTGITCATIAAGAALSISNNNFQGFVQTVAGSGAHTYITYTHAANTATTDNISNNTFTNLVANTSGDVNFILRSGTMAVLSGATDNCNNNSIVTAFSKTVAGGIVTLYNASSGSLSGNSMNQTGNDFSNISLVGATTMNGWSNTEGGLSGPVKTISNNVFDNWACGTAAVTVITSNFGDNNTTVSNNTISNISAAAAITAITLGSSNKGLLQTCSGNTIADLTSTGGSVNGIVGGATTVTTLNINSNTISGLSSSSASSGIAAIRMLTASTTNVSKNKIYDLSASNATCNVNGIIVLGTAAGTYNINNNLLGDFRADLTNSTIAIRGINLASITAGTAYNVFYNTVFINALAGGTNFGTSALAATVSATAANGTLNLRNNILVNTSLAKGTGLAVSYSRSGTSLNNFAASSNNNIFYAGTPSATNLIFSDGTNFDQTLAAYQTRVAARDAASFTELPPFISTVGSSPDFLHLDPDVVTRAESGAVNIATYTDDFDDDIRQGNAGYDGIGSAPDIGADEIANESDPPVITYTKIPSPTCINGDKTLAGVVITDVIGIPLAGVNIPRIYFRKNAGTWFSRPGTNTGGTATNSTWSFTIVMADMGGVTGGDLVRYYIIAQDLVPVPNVGSNPASGLVATNVNSVTTAPSVPNSILIRALPVATIEIGGPTTFCEGESVTLTANAGIVWREKASMSLTRQQGVGFSIGTKGYIATGVGSATGKDLWEYDPGTDSWTQKANFGGTARVGAIGFSIGTKGFVGTGFDGAYRKDFWEYNPATNSWVQKADFGGVARWDAVGFSIGSKGYVGTGENSAGVELKDFWEYDPVLNTWVQKTDFGGVARTEAAGFSIGTKGYIGTGYQGSNYSGLILKDFWEFDQLTNSWVQKADVGGPPRLAAIGLSVGNKGYIGAGEAFSGDFWEYDQANNTWTSMPPFPPGSIDQTASFAIGDKGYVGTGDIVSARNDFWEFGPSFTYLWSTGETTQQINPAITGNYTVTLTDTLGCVSLVSSPVSVTVNPKPVATISAGGPTTFCNGGNVTLTASAGASWLWSTGATTQSINVTATGNFTVTVTNAAGCFATSTVTAVTVNSNPTATISAGGPTTFCSGSNVTLTASAGASWLWSTGATTQSINVTATGNFSVTVTNAAVCFATSGITSVTVNPSPTATISAGGPTTFCSGGNVILSADPTANFWTQKTDLGGIARERATAFSIGSKGYIGCGTDGTRRKDFWEYDPVTNAWTQKADFGGTARERAVGFSIGSKGYLGTGFATAATKDFWEYDPVTNAWTQKADFAGTARHFAVGFNIGTKGYIGTGTDGANKNDFYEYNPATDVWTQKANFGGVARFGATGFSIGTKGYIGTGLGGSNQNDFWEYNPATDIWTQRASFGGTARTEAFGVSIGNKGFIGLGTDGARKNDFWEYNPVLDVWTQKANFSGAARRSAAGFSIGTRAYVGTGNDVAPKKDFWEYIPDYTYNWSTGATTQNITVSASGNYTVTVTDVLGCSNTSSATTVTVNANPTATISAGGPTTFCNGGNVTLTASAGASWLWSTGATTQSINVTATGNFTVTVTNAAGCFATSTVTAVTVNSNPTATISAGGPTTFCSGGNVTLTASAGTSWLWSTGATTQSINVTATGNYSVTVTNAAGCSTTSAATSVTVNPSPTATISAGGPTTFCSGGNVTLTASAALSYTWSTGATTPSISATTTGIYHATLTAANGCSTVSNYILVKAGELPDATVSALGPINFCLGNNVNLSAIGGNTWAGNGFLNAGRVGASAFSIGNKGYIGLGNTGSHQKDFWEFNPITGVFTQKADFAGAERTFATSFSIGAFGYIGTGQTFFNVTLNDFWEYNPVTNTWLQKASLPAIARHSAFGFSIGNKGYLGTGADNINNVLGDFWEYNQATNTWIQKASHPFARYAAVGFSIGNLGYMGTAPLNDFWEYNPVTDIWTQKANFGGPGRSYATGFSIGNKGYLGTGTNGSVSFNDFWEYDVLTDTWTQKANFIDGSPYGAVGFSIGSKGYIGTGFNGLFSNSMAEYRPDYNYLWSNGPVTQMMNTDSSGSYILQIANQLGCVNTSTATVVTVNTINTWAGGGTNNWNTASNWSCGIVPNHPKVDVVVNNGAVPMPVLTTDVLVRTLALNGSSTVDINGRVLTINKNITGTGNLKGSNISGLVLKGATGTVNFAAGSNFLNSLLLTDTASATLGTALNIESNFTVGKVTVNANAVLNANGNLTLKSSVIGTSYVSNMAGAITGDVIVERYIHTGISGGAHAKTWQFLATPTTGQTIRQAWQENGTTPAGFGTIITGTGTGFDITTALPSLKFFNDAAVNWTAVTNTNTALQQKLGYMLFVRGDRTVTTSGAAPNNTILRSKGTLFQPSNPPPSVAVAANKFQTFGNPYASRIEFSKVRAASTGINDVFYVWDPKLAGNYNVGGYQTITGLAGYIPTVGTPPTGNPATDFYQAGVPAPYIESGQAVFVKGNGTGGNVNFNETVKADGSRLVNRPGTTNNELANRAFIFATLFTHTGNIADGNIVACEEGLGNELNELDALKIMNSGENFGIIRSDSLLAVEARNLVMSNDTIFYHFQNLKKLPYQFRFAPVNMRSGGLHAYLIDRFTNSSTEVSMTDSSFISFTITEDVQSQAADRFILVFKKQKQGPVKPKTPKDAQELARSTDASGIETIQTNASITVYPNPVVDQQINIRFSNMSKGNYKVELINKQGQLVYSGSKYIYQQHTTHTIKLNSVLASGSYQLSVVAEDGKRVVESVMVK